MITVGFEVGTAKEVAINPLHLVITGMTQQSGKTTTLEALLHRSNKKALVFKTKPGEKTNFLGGQIVAPYFKENSDWEYVASLLEATMRERMKFERQWIIDVCRNTSSLLQVKNNIDERLANTKIQGLSRGIFTTLQAYFQKILPELAATPLANRLSLPAKINIMDMERLSEPVQSLVIRSCMETVLKEMTDIVVVIPEAWRIIPQDRGNPCKVTAEAFVRQGATNGNLLWIDSQDVTGIDKAILKLVSTWILGLQSELNEVNRTINQMPVPKKNKPKSDEIMTLQKGQFFVCGPAMMKKVYVQPAWLDAGTAQLVADGTISVEEVKKPIMADLPPVPLQVSDIPFSQNDVDIAAFRKEVKELRADVMKQVGDLFEYVKQFASQATQAKVAPAPIVDEESIALRVASKMPIPKPSEAVDVETIVAEVMRRIPKNGIAGASYSVAPLEALKKKFLEEAKTRIVEKIEAISVDAKKMLLFVESQGKGVSQSTLATKCFGYASGEGSSGVKVKTLSVDLNAAGLLKRDTAHSTTHPRLKEKLKEEVALHGAAEPEIKELYNHVIHSILGG